MNVQVRRQLAEKKRLPKKPAKQAVLDSHVFAVSIARVFKGKSVAISHGKLRDRTLRHHLGKFYKTPHARQPITAHQLHSVELTDDVIVVDRHGHRVLPPSYAALRIDQLPQFKKG